MTEKELNKVYETIDLLKLLSKRGQEEIRHFSHYLIFYGFYIAACILVALLFQTYLWLELLYMTGCLSLLSKKIGLKNVIVIILWGIAFAGFYIVKTTVDSLPFLAVAILLTLSAAYIITMLMRRSCSEDKIPFFQAFRKYIALKVATIFWVTPAAGGLFNALFYKNMTGSNIYGAFWAIIYGVCLFASGIIAPGFYIIGLFSLFIIPLLYSFGTIFGLASYGILGCSVACYGIYLKIRK